MLTHVVVKECDCNYVTVTMWLKEKFELGPSNVKFLASSLAPSPITITFMMLITMISGARNGAYTSSELHYIISDRALHFHLQMQTWCYATYREAETIELHTYLKRGHMRKYTNPTVMWNWGGGAWPPQSQKKSNTPVCFLVFSAMTNTQQLVGHIKLTYICEMYFIANYRLVKWLYGITLS
jgi:hypothetical protein